MSFYKSLFCKLLTWNRDRCRSTKTWLHSADKIKHYAYSTAYCIMSIILLLDLSQLSSDCFMLQACYKLWWWVQVSQVHLSHYWVKKTAY